MEDSPRSALKQFSCVDMEIADAVFSFEYDGEDFTIPLHKGAFILKGCEWRPENGQPEYVVIYVHGLGTFLTTKHDVADVITADGGAFMGCDHLGHGRSPGFRSSCTIEEICQETELVIMKAKESFPEVPIFLFGNSMGSLATLQLVFQHSMFCTENLKGVIIESPWISNARKKPITLLESAGIWLISKFSPLSIVSTGDEQYAADIRKDFVEKVQACPLFSPFTTPRLLNSALRAMNYGGADSLVDPVANEAWFKDLKEASVSEAVTYKIYPEATHSLLKGPFRAQILRDILDFIHKYKGSE